MTAYAQITPTNFDDLTDDVAISVFSDYDDDGNEAVSEEVLAYINFRERKTTEGNFHHSKAMQVLESLWEKVKDEQFNYKTHDRGMFKRINVLRGGLTDDLIHRDQFPFG